MYVRKPLTHKYIRSNVWHVENFSTLFTRKNFTRVWDWGPFCMYIYMRLKTFSYAYLYEVKDLFALKIFSRACIKHVYEAEDFYIYIIFIMLGIFARIL